MTDEKILELEAKGFKRWQKYGRDRLYIDVTKLGLDVGFYNTGNINHSIFDDESISHADAARLLADKFYIDVMTGEAHGVNRGGRRGQHDTLFDRALQKVKELAV